MKTANHRSRVRPHATTTRLLLPGVVFLFFMILPTEGPAQVMRWLMPDSVKPLDPPYNVRSDEFLTGLLFSKPTRDQKGSVTILWDFARFMNASDWIWGRGYSRNQDETIELHEYHLQLDTLLTTADSGERFMVTIPPTDGVAGAQLGNNGQMLEVFFFDSVQSPYSVWKFLGVDTAKGELRSSTYYDNSSLSRIDWPWKNPGPRERRYTDPQDAGLIAEHLAVQYNLGPGLSWLQHTTSQWEADHFLDLTYRGKPSDQRKLWVALKGHLPDVPDTTVALSDTLFRIELYHVVPSGYNYLERAWDTVIIGTDTTISMRDTLFAATALTERLLDDFSVTKADLLAGTDPNPAYRDVSFSTDLRYRFGDTNLYGPLVDGYPNRDRDNGRLILEVKVYWTGLEQPSVRSLMFRNERAEMMYGVSPASNDFRRGIGTRGSATGAGGVLRGGPLRGGVVDR